MAMINLQSAWNILPEGEQVLHIKDVTYDENFQIVKVLLENKEGVTCLQTYKLLDGNGNVNNKAIGAFAYLAKAALNDDSVTQIDHTAIIDNYIKVTVVHNKQVSKDDPNKTMTFINFKNTSPASGFDDEEDDVDLDALVASIT